MTKEGKNPVGRPPAMTPAVLSKLQEGFLMGLNDTLACLHADIHPSILYRYCDENPDFREKKEQWKKNPGYKAVKIINNALDNGDLNTAKFVAERRLKDEWSTRTEQTGADGEALNPPKILVEFVGVKND